MSQERKSRKINVEYFGCPDCGSYRFSIISNDSVPILSCNDCSFCVKLNDHSPEETQEFINHSDNIYTSTEVYDTADTIFNIICDIETSIEKTKSIFGSIGYQKEIGEKDIDNAIENVDLIIKNSNVVLEKTKKLKETMEADEENIILNIYKNFVCPICKARNGDFDIETRTYHYHILNGNWIKCYNCNAQIDTTLNQKIEKRKTLKRRNNNV